MRKITISGLVLFGVSSGLGLFLGSNPSNLLLSLWLTGYLLLAMAVSYSSFFSKERLNFFPFIALGAILLNFFVQLTGGAHSTLWPAYILFAVLVAAFSLPWQTYATVGLILAIEASNLFFSGRWQAEKWPLYAGVAGSLAGISAAISYITNRTRREAEEVRAEHDRLIEKADAYDPLADTDKLESLVSRQAANVSAARERENAFSGLITMISEFVPAHTYALFLRERRERGEVFTLRAVKSESDGMFLLPIGTVLDPQKSRGLIDICAEQKQPQYLSDMVLPLKNIGYYADSAQTVPVRSFLVLPILHDDRTIGVLAVDSLEQGAFSLETQDMLTRFTPFFIQIIEKIQLYQELDIKAKHFAALHELSVDLNGSLEIADILDKVTSRIKIAVPYDRCAFVLYEENEKKMTLQALRGYRFTSANNRFDWDENMDKDAHKTIDAENESAILYHMHSRWQRDHGSTSYYTPDFGDRGRDIGLFPLKFKELQQPLRSLYGQLLVSKDKFIGAFFLVSDKADAFTEYHRNFLDTLLNQVSMVVDNSMLHKRIRDMAHTDGLTGLLNHRTFMEKLDEEFKRLDRAEYQHFSLLLLDIDYFKKVNDEHGHPVGDVALKSVAGVVRQMARSIDFVARYGGEEFAVGMVGADAEGAKLMAERIRKSVENTVITVEKITLRKTVSIGVASYYQGCGKKEVLIAEADQALYHAKNSGRNRVSVYKDIKDSVPVPEKQGLGHT